MHLRYSLLTFWMRNGDWAFSQAHLPIPFLRILPKQPNDRFWVMLKLNKYILILEPPGVPRFASHLLANSPGLQIFLQAHKEQMNMRYAAVPLWWREQEQGESGKDGRDNSKWTQAALACHLAKLPRTGPSTGSRIRQSGSMALTPWATVHRFLDFPNLQLPHLYKGITMETLSQGVGKWRDDPWNVCGRVLSTKQTVAEFNTCY